MFATVLSIIFTDAYFMYRADYKSSNGDDENGILSFEDFLGELSYQMIHNQLDAVESEARTRNVRQTE